MAYSKIILNGETLMDVTSDTVTVDKLIEGYTATKNDGTKITGANSGVTLFTATITGTGNSSYCYVTYKGTKYTSSSSFSYKAGDSLTIYCRGNGVMINGEEIPLSNYSYAYTLPVGDIDISLTYMSSTTNFVTILGLVKPQGTYVVDVAGIHDVYSYRDVEVSGGSARPAGSVSATGATVTTGTNTLTLSKSVSNTPQVSEGYITGGTAGNTSVSLTATVNTRGSSDLTASGATVTAPAGYYASSASKSVATGTAGTPTATKGTVSNNSVSVTPSVTNSAGYITGGTKTGTAVTVSASELVSGTKSITSNGTGIDVTNYASVNVDVGSNNVVAGTFTASATTGTKQTITIPYSGNGYPIHAHIEVAGGYYNSNNTINPSWYNTIRQFSICQYTLSKRDTSTNATYSYDYGTVLSLIKDTSDGYITEFSRSAYYSARNGASAMAYESVMFMSKTQLSVFISDSGTRGFMPGIIYDYTIVYSE